MIIDSMQPSDNLLVGRRALEELRFFELLEDWIWFSKPRKWGLRCRLRVNGPPNAIVPSLTDWYVLVTPTYPWGEIDFCPAKEGGLTITFQHQNLNLEGDPDFPWRDGKICNQTSLRHFERRGYDIEPMTPHERLTWHVVRTHAWLSAASEGSLCQPGEPFELPFVGIKSAERIAFSENSESYHLWTKIGDKCGYASVVHHNVNARLYFVKSFKDAKGKELVRFSYGSDIEASCKETVDAMWVLLELPPILPPWQIPTTFSELKQALDIQRIDVKTIILDLAQKIRDGKRHFLMIGFPIPKKIGEQPERLHWLGFSLPPELSMRRVKGFRPKETSHRRYDELAVLRDTVSLDWVATENWHSDQIRSRGQLPEEITRKKILVIGAGALGSHITDLLIRAGTKRLSILDGDLVEVGNLCRHTAEIPDVGKFKAETIAAHLNAASPHAHVDFINKEFSECDKREGTIITDFDMVIDCTASDALLNEMATFGWTGEKLFISVSVGLFARRLFYLAFRGRSFPQEAFARVLSPWIHREIEEHNGLQLPREGIGCWNPVFPAGADDICLMSSIAVKLLAYDCRHLFSGGIFRVFEQLLEDGGLGSIRKVQEVECG